MLTAERLNGIYVPVITPFTKEEELDLDAYTRFLDYLLPSNIHGLVLNGTTAEAPTLEWEEISTLIQVTRSTMSKHNKQLPLVVGTGTNSTRSTIRRTEEAGKLGADAVLVVTPYYNRPSQEGIIEHYRRVSEVGVPVVAYEVPARTAVRILPSTADRILELDGVIGMKDSTGGTELLRGITSTKPILCGDDQQFLPMLGLGAAGGMLASANIRPVELLQVYQLFQEGNLSAAEERFSGLIPLIRLLFQESNPAPIKWSLMEMGILPTDTLRSPMAPISQGLQEQLRGILNLQVS